jgi:gamma-glutamyltranspeptidase/glutathione hydrolase
MASGTQIIVRRDGHLEGGADSRREGIAAGD